MRILLPRSSVRSSAFQGELVWPAGGNSWANRLNLCARTSAWRRIVARAFTLIEVMIACGIFFMATFAILALVSTTLRNARALQRGDVDAGMAAAQIYQLLKTNRDVEVSGKGDFGEAYPDYSYQFASQEYMSNGLLQVEIIVNRRDLRKPVDSLTIFVYNPEARSGIGPPRLR